MSGSDKSTRAGLFTKLGYIFDKRDKWKIGVLLIAVVVGSFLELLGVTIFMPYIEIISDPTTIQKTWYLKWVYDLFGFSSPQSFTITVFIFSGVLFAVSVYPACTCKETGVAPGSV